MPGEATTADDELTRELRARVTFYKETALRGTRTLREEFVLQHGRRWTPQPAAARRVRRERECFWNAYSLAQDSDGELRYCEGFAFDPDDPSILAAHHGWTVDPSDRVVDPTWPRPERCAYFGIAFPLPIAALVVVENKPLLEDCNDRRLLAAPHARHTAPHIRGV